MTNNTQADHKNIIITKPIQQNYIPMQFNFGNKIVPAPGPSMVTKM
jgi:hypothetical protein